MRFAVLGAWFTALSACAPSSGPGARAPRATVVALADEGANRDAASRPVPAPPSTSDGGAEVEVDVAMALLAPETRALAERIAALRGLRWRHAPKIEILAGEDFERRAHAAVNRGLDAPSKNHVRREAEAEWLHLAFGLPPPARGRNGGVSPYQGLYDFSRHELLVRERPLVSTTMSGERADGSVTKAREGVLVHELVHALQDQTFGLVGDDGSTDGELARRAVYEGDAVLLRERFAAASAGVDEATFLARAVGAVEAKPTQVVLRTLSGASHVLGAAIARRETALFPYLSGLRFAWARFKAGGNAALDGAYAKPPTSTMAVLHPEKYARGVEPIAVAEPPLPLATERLGGGTLGEFRTSLLLARCEHDPERLRLDARGWAGDRFVVGRRTSGAIVARWATAWDDGASAARFAARVEAVAACTRPALSLRATRSGTTVLVERAAP